MFSAILINLKGQEFMIRGRVENFYVYFVVAPSNYVIQVFTRDIKTFESFNRKNLKLSLIKMQITFK